MASPVGWSLTTEWLAQCDGNSAVQVEKAAINTDLKQCGSQVLPAELGATQITSIPGPLVLQVLKVKNISAPTDNQKSDHAPRMLRVQMTDGHTKCFGVEVNPKINRLTLDTPPGTKIRFATSEIQVLNGFIILPVDLEVLGGRVPELVERWDLQRQLGAHHRVGGDTGDRPPLFAAAIASHMGVETTPVTLPPKDDERSIREDSTRCKDSISNKSNISNTHVGSRRNEGTSDGLGNGGGSRNNVTSRDKNAGRSSARTSRDDMRKKTADAPRNANRDQQRRREKGAEASSDTAHNGRHDRGKQGSSVPHIADKRDGPRGKPTHAHTPQRSGGDAATERGAGKNARRPPRGVGHEEAHQHPRQRSDAHAAAGGRVGDADTGRTGRDDRRNPSQRQADRKVYEPPGARGGKKPRDQPEQHHHTAPPPREHRRERERDAGVGQRGGNDSGHDRLAHLQHLQQLQQPHLPRSDRRGGSNQGDGHTDSSDAASGRASATGGRNTVRAGPLPSARGSAAGQPTQYDAMIAALVTMGFTQHQVDQACAHFDAGSTGEAVDWLLGGGDAVTPLDAPQDDRSGGARRAKHSAGKKEERFPALSGPRDAPPSTTGETMGVAEVSRPMGVRHGDRQSVVQQPSPTGETTGGGSGGGAWGAPSGTQWLVGALCQALYAADGRFYDAVVVAPAHDGCHMVMYEGYNEIESVRTTDIRPRGQHR